MKKTPKCKGCGETGHYEISCRKTARKPIKSTNKPLKAKKPKVPKKKVETRSQLVKKLDTVYSQYIRLKKSDKNGYCTCITCGGRFYWKDIQNGHYVSRGKYPTRWLDMNCHPQCMRDNVFLRGMYIEYTMFMIDTYGRDAVDALLKLSTETHKIPTAELKDKITYYKTEVSRLLTTKG